MSHQDMLAQISLKESTAVNDRMKKAGFALLFLACERGNEFLRHRVTDACQGPKSKDRRVIIFE